MWRILIQWELLKSITLSKNFFCPPPEKFEDNSLFYWSTFPVSPFPSSYCFLSFSQEQSVMWTPPPSYIYVPTSCGVDLCLCLFYFTSLCGPSFSATSTSPLSPPSLIYIYLVDSRVGSCRPGPVCSTVLVSGTCLLVATLGTPETDKFLVSWKFHCIKILDSIQVKFQIMLHLLLFVFCRSI